FSAGAATSALVWDLSRIRPAPHPLRELNAAEIEMQWAALPGQDAAKAFEAMLTLLASPTEAVVFLAKRLEPAPRIDGKLLDKLIADLDSGQFKVRQQASAELLKLDDRALPAIDNALAATPPLEAKKRLEDLRHKLTSVRLG